MSLTILKELLIFVGCLPVFPLLVFILLVQTDSLGMGKVLLARAFFWGEEGLSTAALSLWFKLFAPYVLVQTIRAYLWSQRNMVGRKWANLYFSVLSALAAAWTFYKPWDLFYLMYSLGDMPQELPQLLKLEGHNVVICVVSAWLAIHCFRIFLNPMRKPSHPRMVER